MPTGIYPRKPKPTQELFWRHVCKTDSCWLWTGAIAGKYGVFNQQNVTCRPHRLSYKWACGNISTDLLMHHTCTNRLCVNPNHLIAVSPKQHAEIHASTYRKEKHPRLVTPKEKHPRLVTRRSHCPMEHPYNESNTVFAIDRKGNIYKRCRICHNLQLRASRTRKKDRLMGVISQLPKHPFYGNQFIASSTHGM